MSVLSSSPAFMFNLNTQGLFSSQTAFQRPKLNNKAKTAPQPNSRIHLTHSTENLTTKTYKPVQISLKREDPDVLICEPVKRVKLAQDQSQTAKSLINPRNVAQQKPSKLTVEMVFDTPIDTKKTQANNFFDGDDVNEDSSLSFISSCTSIDGLEAIDDEVTYKNSENNECIIVDTCQEDTILTASEPLVVKDSFAGHLTYLNIANYLTPNMINYSMVTPYNQYNAYEPSLYFQNNRQFSNINSQMMTFANSLNGVSTMNQYIQPNLASYQPFQAVMNFPQIRAGDYLQNPANYLFNDKEMSNHINQPFENIRAKHTETEEDGYDSDSYATRSTGLEPNQDGKSQKSASPLYSIGEELPVEEKIQFVSLEAPQKKKRGRKPKNSNQQEAEDVDGNMKAKKGRALNLDIDINPKHLKVERRLNKLQLLRYQQEAPEAEFEEYMKKLTEMEPLSRNNSLFNETNDSQSTGASEGRIDSQVPTIENTLATIPPLNMEPRRRVNLATRWTPSQLNKEELDVYFQQLGEAIEFPVTDQERGLELLKAFGMNITATIEAVRENKALYSELLKIKVKRLRRR